MVNTVSFLLYICILTLSCTVSYYVGKYQGLKDAVQEDEERRRSLPESQ